MGRVGQAAYCIPANIAEGFGRRHRNDRLRFLNYAEGSIAEVDYCLHAAWRLEYISKEQLEQFRADLKAVNAPLMGLIRHIRLAKAVEIGVIVIGPTCPTCPAPAASSRPAPPLSSAAPA